jgi:hypothetical protein
MSAARPLLAAALAAAALAFCLPASAATRVYDVDPAYRQEVYAVLTRLLDVQGDASRSGKVEILPNGQLVVDTASDERQDEVAAILTAIARNRPAETPTISLRYWFLDTRPDAGTAPPPILASVLGELEAVHGDREFRVVDAATVTGRAGQRTYFESAPWTITQSANVSGERLNAEIYLEHASTDPSASVVPERVGQFVAATQRPRQLQVQISLTPGQFVVLGSGTTPTEEADGVTALVVQWPEAE